MLQFLAAQRGVVRVCRHLGSAIVGEEEDERVVVEPLRFERIDDFANAGIEVIDHGQQDFPGRVGAVLVLSFDILDLRLERSVHGIVGQIDQERLLAVPLDEIHRFVRQTVGQVAFFPRPLQTVRPSEERGEIGYGVVEIIVIPAAVIEAIELVKAPLRRISVRGNIHRLMPFAKRTRDIAGLFQIVRQQAHTPGGGFGPMDASPLLIPAGEHRRARGKAHCGGDITLLENHAVAGDLVDIRSDDARTVLRVEPNIRIALVIRENNHDVRLAV